MLCSSDGGLLISTDGGRDFKQGGLPLASGPYLLAFSPDCTRDGIIGAMVPGVGAYLPTDRGATWTPYSTTAAPFPWPLPGTRCMWVRMRVPAGCRGCMPRLTGGDLDEPRADRRIENYGERERHVVRVAVGGTTGIRDHNRSNRRREAHPPGNPAFRFR